MISFCKVWSSTFVLDCNPPGYYSSYGNCSGWRI